MQYLLPTGPWCWLRKMGLVWLRWQIQTIGCAAEHMAGRLSERDLCLFAGQIPVQICLPGGQKIHGLGIILLLLQYRIKMKQLSSILRCLSSHMEKWNHSAAKAGSFHTREVLTG